MTDEQIAALSEVDAAARTTRISELESQIAEQEGVVADAQQEATDAQAEADAAAVGTDDASLQAALEAMSNKTVNDDVMNWAKEVLGVGEEIGKIDQMVGVIEAQTDEAGTESTDPEETVDPVE